MCLFTGPEAIFSLLVLIVAVFTHIDKHDMDCFCVCFAVEGAGLEAGPAVHYSTRQTRRQA